MARLPHPGGDPGQWGDILNEFLAQSHTSDGALKPDTVGAAQLMTNAITNTAIAPGAAIEQNKIAGLIADLATKADDDAVVHLAGNESITGDKNFIGDLTHDGHAVVTVTDGRLTDQRVPIDGSVTTGKLADGSVSAQKLQGGRSTARHRDLGR